MKKKYLSPKACIVEMQAHNLLTGSTSTPVSDDSANEPARSRGSVWDDYRMKSHAFGDDDEEDEKV
jgi:hypothetical protein